MIRYFEAGNIWISNLNLDETGMPTTNLHGDWEICTCSECRWALEKGKGENFDILFSEEPSYLRIVR